MDITNFIVIFQKEITHISFNTILKYVEKGVLYPLSYYDGDWYGKDEVNSRFGCIWHGANRSDIIDYEKHLSKN